MSKGVNKWLGIGNACADPEVRNMPNGTMVVNLTVACNDGYKDKNTGQMVDATEFVRIVFFNRLAEIVSEYVKKGSKVYIEGKLKTRSWEQDGVKRYATEIVANDLQMLDSRESHPQESQARKPAPRQNGTQKSAAPIGFDNFDDELPPF